MGRAPYRRVWLERRRSRQVCYFRLSYTLICFRSGLRGVRDPPLSSPILYFSHPSRAGAILRSSSRRRSLEKFRRAKKLTARKLARRVSSEVGVPPEPFKVVRGGGDRRPLGSTGATEALEGVGILRDCLLR